MGTIRIERLEVSPSSIRCTFDYPEFFDWLAEVDIDRFVDESNSSGYRAYRLTRLLPSSPVVHSARRRVLDAIW